MSETIITEIRRALWTLPALASMDADSHGRIVDAAVNAARRELDGDKANEANTETDSTGEQS